MEGNRAERGKEADERKRRGSVKRKGKKKGMVERRREEISRGRAGVRCREERGMGERSATIIRGHQCVKGELTSAMQPSRTAKETL